MGEDSLDPYQKVDRALVLAELRGEHALQPFERWRRQPSLYTDLITRGAYYILLRGYSGPEDRLAMLAERLAEAPAALDAARANLDPARVPPEWIAIAERTAPAGAAFLRDELPKSLPDTSLGRVVGRALLPAANAAADALDRYVAWLRADLLPRAKGTFAIGRETFEALLKEKELLDHDASSLRAYGEELFRETESKIAEAARALGDDDWRDSVARLRRDHPEADQLVDTYRVEMERSREAVRLSSIASIPYGEDLAVDVGLATGDMSFDEAVAYMVERPRLEPPNAIAEVRRYTLTPTQPSSYALGREAILVLRDKARAKGWGMRFFHDKLLGAGSLPPKLLARDVDL